MDPNATWLRMVAAMRDGDSTEFYEAAHDLQFWVERGGIYPVAWMNDPSWRTILALLTSGDD